MNPERIDKQEDARVERMRKEARKGRILRQSNAKGRSGVTIRLAPRVLGLTAAGTVQAMQKQIQAAIAKEQFLAERPPIIHVKDGKPLTAHGAKLLGVPWEEK